MSSIPRVSPYDVITPRKLTAKAPDKMMVGRRSFPFEMVPTFVNVFVGTSHFLQGSLNGTAFWGETKLMQMYGRF